MLTGGPPFSQRCASRSIAPRMAGPIHAAETSIQGRRCWRMDTQSRYTCRDRRATTVRVSGSAARVFVIARDPVHGECCRPAPCASEITPMTPSVTSVDAPAGTAAPTTPEVLRPLASRLASLDLVRGLVMVLMTIDHVRVFAGVPAGGPTPGVYFTRWITHFCAPAFVFFA